MKIKPKQRDIAMVFQSYALYPHMTVAAKHGVLPPPRWCAKGGDRQARW